MIARLLGKLGLGSPAKAAEPRLPEGMRIYAVGDIHGRIDLLERLYQAIAEDLRARPVTRAVEVFLGDYVDRGPGSAQVLDWLTAGPRLAAERVCLRGNHEQVLLEFLADPAVLGHWSQFGGLETLHSFGLRFRLPLRPGDEAEIARAFAEALPAAHRRFLEATQPSLTLGGYFFSHAGVNPAVALDAQAEHDLLWIREPFLSWHRPLSKIVVHGHTPIESPVVLPHRIGIDTGAYVTGRLTAAVLEGGEVSFLTT